MDPQEAYNIWAQQYDTNENKTRDLEGKSLRETLSGFSFNHCLEMGCGTGKNTEWLINKAKKITAVDLSEEMLARARTKIDSDHVEFLQADIIKEWHLPGNDYDLVTFSLVLEHVENLDHIFHQVSKIIVEGGYVYVGELHPFKQYAGSKARFEIEEGIKIVDCYNHHLSDFVGAAKRNGLTLLHLAEYFDDDDKNNLPRILTLLFKK